MGIEYGEGPPKLIDIYCQIHGPLGQIPASDVDDIVKAHREKFGCYGKIDLGLVIQKTPVIEEKK